MMMRVTGGGFEFACGTERFTSLNAVCNRSLEDDLIKSLVVFTMFVVSMFPKYGVIIGTTLVMDGLFAGP